MRSRRLWIPVLFAAFTFCSLSQAGAESLEFPLPTATERALEYYGQASDAYQQGDYGRAVELLARAFAHDPDLIYPYNQALAYLGMGEEYRALQVLETYGEDMEGDERFPELDELLREVRETIARDETALQESPSAERPETSPPLLAYSLIGAGGLALATGGLLSSGLLISDTIERIEDSRTPDGLERHYGEGSSRERDQDLQTLRTHRALAMTTLIGGTVLAGTGIALLLRATDTARGDDSPVSFLQLEPHLDPHFVGATLRGSF